MIGYFWKRIVDKDIVGSLENANKAQDTADHKRRVFVVLPTPPYDIGDLWHNGSAVLRCQIPKDSTGAYAVGDFINAADLTIYNTAAAIAGQGDLATNNRANLLYADGADHTAGALQAGTSITAGGVTLTGGTGQFIVKDAAGTIRVKMGYLL